MRFVCLFILFLFSSHLLLAQDTDLKKGNHYYENGDYLSAVKYFEKSIQHSNDIFTKKKIINCYRLTNQIEHAENYLKEICQDSSDEIYCNYYLNLLIKKHDFISIESLIKRGVFKSNLSEIKNNIESLYSDSSNYQVYALEINSENADMGLVTYKNGYVFSSSRNINSSIEKKHTWTNQPFLKLFYCDNIDNIESSPTLFSSDIRSKYNLGPVCFSNKEKEIWVTENYSSNNEKSNQNKYKLKISQYKYSDGKWIKQKPFPYNNPNYNVAHPAISSDGNELYFSSDLPGGFGGMDLYVCRKTKKGWSAPVNLGSQLNTISNDVFPTILQDGTIYFSSDGLIGLGGLDLYYTKNIDGNYLTPVNAGAPINSSADDFHLIYNSKNKKGFFSSNRIHGGFNDDLFSFIKNKETKSDYKKTINDDNVRTFDSSEIKSNARHLSIKENNEPISGVKIIDDKNKIIGITNENGDVYIDSSLSKVRTFKDGFYAKEIIFNDFNKENNITIKKSSVPANADWYKIIYYDLDKSDIRTDMQEKMKEVVSFMQAHPELKITITSFTDSRASVNYNAKLSQRRSSSIENYLLLHGILKKQINKIDWKGEGILVNNCGDNLPCTEEMHQLNRRTEIFVSSLIK
jgi:tetratricopeptide (TPR) repeat protein